MSYEQIEPYIKKQLDLTGGSCISTNALRTTPS